ncbi:hypothetical protein [Mesorhizobium sp. M1252]|uniref:hypothetical protein n=1 Tax=Mesorhizobium sp. M1252 TaxID=2957073 RepID=UPI003336A495
MFVAHHQTIGEKTRRRIQKQGVTCRGYKLWTDAEDGICRDGYPDYAAISRALPHRSRCAIKSRCVSIGITKSSTWTAKRDTLFRKLYRTATTKVLYEAFPEMESRAIFDRGSQQKLSRPRKPYETTGIGLLDTLREECWRQNISMADLDEFANAKRYFKDKRWRGKRGTANYNCIVRAIHELGGTLSVQWGSVH